MRLWKGVISSLSEPARAARRRQLLVAMAAGLAARSAFGQKREGLAAVGFLGENPQDYAAALAALGYEEGRNLRYEVQAAASLRALPGAAMQLIAKQPAAFVASGPAVLSLAAFTQTIPIVCAGFPDPVGARIAQSLRRPGGNVTGLATGIAETAAATFALLRQMRPRLRRVAVLHAPGMPVEVQMRMHAEAAKEAGLEWMLAPVSGSDDIERALAPIAGEAAWMAPMGRLWKEALVIAHKHRVATLGAFPGSLMNYAREFAHPHARVAAILVQVLQGANPAEIPFELPDRHRLVINRSTAKAIGVEIPAEVALRATELVD